MAISKDPPAREASSSREPGAKLIISQLRYLGQQMCGGLRCDPGLSNPIMVHAQSIFHFNGERVLVEPEMGFEASEGVIVMTHDLKRLRNTELS